MKKGKILKTIAVACTVGILSTGLITKSVYADENGKWTKNRLYGSNRFETANKIADEFVKTNSQLGIKEDKFTPNIYPDTAKQQVDTVILANGFNFPDAMCATPLSKKLNAPILLTSKNNLTPSTKQEIKKLKIKKVTIVGEKGVVSNNVENQLKAMNLKVNRIGGKDRYETSYLIAKEFTEGKKIEQATAVSGMVWQDAMISSPAATIKDAPILLVPISDNEVLPKYKTLLQKNDVDITDIDIYGDYKKITSNILRKMIPNNLHVDKKNEGILYHTYEAGLENKYVNCIGILNHAYTRDLPYNVGENVFLTRGDDFADSLTVGPLAAKKASPIIFGTTVHKGWSKWEEFVNDSKLETIRLDYPIKPEEGKVFGDKVVNRIRNTMDKVTLVGGPKVMPENADKIFKNIWK